MKPSDDSLAAARFAQACTEARAHLRRQMEERGMHERDGWKVVETMRQGARGAELVMRPLHLRHVAPDDLECIVAIDEGTTEVDSSCAP